MGTYILTGLGIVALIFFLLKRDKKSSIAAIVLKSMTSIFFIASGISSLVLNYMHTGIGSTFKLISMALIIIGLVCGMVGDILLDFKIYFKALNMRFLCFDKDRDVLMTSGMASFGVGHILYIVSIAIRYPDNIWMLAVSVVIGFALMSGIMLFSRYVMKMDFRQFFIPSWVYGTLLATFIAYSAFTLSIDGSVANIILLIGSILFIVSDLILSITYFSKAEDYEKEGMMNPESKLMIVVNHATYYIAQFLIALSILYF